MWPSTCAPGSDLDLEARLRGTSVYFPDRAIPMLPQELSTDICSLRPNEDRLVLSCIMQLDADGRIESYEIVEGVIRSAARMTYTDVHAILEATKKRAPATPHSFPSFERMRKTRRPDEQAPRGARLDRLRLARAGDRI
jgi:ribonuclease R